MKRVVEKTCSITNYYCDVCEASIRAPLWCDVCGGDFCEDHLMVIFDNEAVVYVSICQGCADTYKTDFEKLKEISTRIGSKVAELAELRDEMYRAANKFMRLKTSRQRLGFDGNTYIKIR